MSGFALSGFGRLVMIGAAAAAGIGVASLRAQTVLGDPRDAARTFAANCSTCHKSPQGLAKSGQVAGFLRQHYTTGPEMSAAMAAYLVAAGNAPAKKEKGGETAAAAKKGKKQEQISAVPLMDERAEAPHHTLQGRQPATKSHETPQTARVTPSEPPAPRHTAPTSPAATPPATADDAAKQSGEPTAANAALGAPATVAAAPAVPAGPPPVVLDIPLPPMPETPPPELTQSAFSSSPLP